MQLHLTFGDLMLLLIAIALWVIVLFGANLVS